MLVVKIVSIKKKLMETLIKIVMSVKKNIQRTSHYKRVKMKTVSVKVFN
jgi:hypothetical protein